MCYSSCVGNIGGLKISPQLTLRGTTALPALRKRHSKIMKSKNALLLLACTSVAPPALADDAFNHGLNGYVAQLSDDCTAIENGVLEVRQGAVRKVIDVNGDGVTDPIVDNGAIACTTSATFSSGGTGGRTISVFVSTADGIFERFEFQGHGMFPLSLGQASILIVPQHGATCEQNGPASCFAAYSWSGDGFSAAGGHITATNQ